MECSAFAVAVLHCTSSIWVAAQNKWCYTAQKTALKEANKDEIIPKVNSRSTVYINYIASTTSQPNKDNLKDLRVYVINSTY